MFFKQCGYYDCSKILKKVYNSLEEAIKDKVGGCDLVDECEITYYEIIDNEIIELEV